jgi:hypothetical protein
MPDAVFRDKAVPDDAPSPRFWLLPDGKKLCLEHLEKSPIKGN